MTNAEAFDRVCGLLFQRLLDAFPKELRLDLRTLDPQTQETPDDEVLNGAMAFLIREGFLTGRRAGDGVPWYANVQLTLRSLTLLRQVPDNLRQRATWGERFTAAAGTAGKEALAVVTRQFLEYAGGQFGLPPRPIAE